MSKASLQLLLDQGLSVEGIARRFGKDPSTISYWLRKHGLKAPGREKYAARGGIDRARLKQLVEEGKTVRELAAEFDRSIGTIRYWLGRFGLRTQGARDRRPARAVQAAKKEGLLTVTMNCRKHGRTEFWLEGRGFYRCKQCRAEAVVRRRRKVKAILVAEAGGRCRICGYDRHVGALQFHHIEPVRKHMNVSARGVALALDVLRAEAAKCVLLCSNCHAEVENGVTHVPLE